LKNNYLEIACLVKCPVLIQLLFGFILQATKNNMKLSLGKT